MTRLDALEGAAKACQLCDSVVSFNLIVESTVRILSHVLILETCSTVLVSEELVFRQLEKLQKQMHSVLKWIWSIRKPSFLDVWGEQSELPYLGTIRIGQFRQPGTMDSWTSVRHLNFLERSAPFMALILSAVSALWL